jgi:L-aspartate oxidase
MKSTGAPCVFLDARHMSKEFLEKRFPKIYTTCLRFGIEMTNDLVPVVPSAHYFCGGVAAEVDGTTAMPGLYACGEVACTGLHGANRLASNSLLEALVCSCRMAERICEDPGSDVCREIGIPPWHYGDAVPSDEGIVVEHNWNEVRTCMWDYVGIVRTNKRLERAERRMQNLRAEIRDYYLDYFVTPDILELRNIADVAQLLVRSAQSRRESRGLQYTLDYAERNDDQFAAPTLIEDMPAGGN